MVCSRHLNMFHREHRAFLYRPPGLGQPSQICRTTSRVLASYLHALLSCFYGGDITRDAPADNYKIMLRYEESISFMFGLFNPHQLLLRIPDFCWCTDRIQRVGVYLSSLRV